MIAPGAWLGLLGGGQLGRMFCMAAQSLGYKVVVLDPGAASPAGSVADRHLMADYQDPDALSELASLAAAATTEFENVPAAALDYLARSLRVSPGAASVAIAQDRISEKTFLAGQGFAVAPFAVLRTEADARAADPALLPGIVKSARLGYDGKGQLRVRAAADVVAAFAEMGGAPCVLERFVTLACEVSVIVARDEDGEAVAWPVAENQHRDGILDVSIVPARVPAETAAKALDRGDDDRREARLPGRALRRDVRRRRRRTARQRDCAAPAQQRPLLDRRVRDLAVRAAGPRARRPAARRDASARACRHGQPAGRSLVREPRHANAARARLDARAAAPAGEAPPLRQGGAPAWPQDGPRRPASARRSPTRSPRRARSSAISAFPAPSSSEGTLAMSAATREGPLAGLRVLDLTRLLPGPVCTLYLADLGADVVKIEDTGAGDYARNLGNRPGTVSAFYRAVNRNKRSARSTSRTHAVVQRSSRWRNAPTSIVESFRPGVVASLGVDHDRSRRSIRASSTRRSRATGRTDRARSAAGHDINYLGYAGVLDQTGAATAPRAVQPADRRPPGRRRGGGDRAPGSARRRAADRARPRTSTSRWLTHRSRTTSLRCTR